jgi:peroxiredoxin
MNVTTRRKVQIKMRIKMRWALVGAIVLASLAVVPLVTPSVGEARVGGRLSNFTLPGVAGGPFRGRFRLQDFIGEKPIVLLFWATWCQPCRQELPVYEALYQQHGADKLTVVGISMDGSNTIAQAGPWVRRLNLTFPVVSDLDSSVTSRLNPRRAAPFSIWADHTGRIVRENEGFSMAERDEITSGIQRLVNRQPLE